MLGIGTYRIAHPYDIVRQGIAHGYQLVDTAELYKNEDEVFAAVQDSNERQHVFVMTKIRPGMAFCHSAANVDALLLHWPSDHFEEDWRKLCEQQPVRHLGVSNFSQAQLECIADIQTPFCNQIEVTPFLPRCNLIRYHSAHDIQTVAYSSLTKGQRLEFEPLQRMAQQHACSPSTILLSWALQRRFWVLPRTINPQHLIENRKQVQLTIDDLNSMAHWNDGFATHPKWAPEYPTCP